MVVSRIIESEVLVFILKAYIFNSSKYTPYPRIFRKVPKIKLPANFGGEFVLCKRYSLVKAVVTEI